MGEPGRISLCIIARDEEKNLGRCLASVDGAVDEIVVVDTGSTDGTVAVAESYGARVFHYPWNGDFAAARNHALGQSTGDWILVLDADEELSPEANGALRKLVSLAGPEVNGFGFLMASWTGERAGLHLSTIVHPRLWRNRPEYRYRGRIHEWVDIGPVVYTGLRIYHYGYLRNTGRKREKAARNIALLQEELRKDPEDGYYLFQLGVEYGRLGQLPRAVACFRRAWQRVQSSFIADRFVLCLLRLRRYREARDLIVEALSRWPDYTDLYYHYGCALMGMGEYEAARATLRRCLEMGPPPPEYATLEGHSSFMAWTQLGHVEAMLHNWADAVGASWQGLLLRPDYTPAVDLLIPSLIALCGAEGALQILQNQVGMEPQTVPVVARRFAEWGCWLEALALLEQATALLPAHRVLRAECMLAVGRAGEAEAELERVLEQVNRGSPEWKDALFVRLQALWLCGNLDAAAAVLDQLSRSRYRTAATHLSRFHEQLAGRSPGPPDTAGEAARLLGLMERLLAYGRPDLADQLLPLLEAAGDSVTLLGAVGRLFTRFGRVREARRFLEQALRDWGLRSRELPVVGGGRCDLLADLGEVSLRSGQYLQAGRAFRTVLQREPDRVAAYLALSESHVREAIRLLPERKRAAYHSLAEEMNRERRRAEPVYDREGRGAQPAPGSE